MSAYQRAKGARGEREAAAALTAVTGRVFVRSARNGVDGATDVAPCDPALAAMSIEVKLRSTLTLARWMQQAQGDNPLLLPMVLTREDGGPWMACIRLQDLPRWLAISQVQRAT